MSLNSNTTGLEEILASVNALPEAGSGGGGSVETCTVTITPAVQPKEVVYVSSLDGNYTLWQPEDPLDYPQPFTCVCNTIIYVSSSHNLITTNAQQIISRIYIITAPAGENTIFDA